MVHGASSDSCYEFSGWLQSNTMQNVFALSILQKIYFKTAFHFAFLEYRSVCIGLRFFRVHKHSNGRFHELWTHNEAFFHWNSELLGFGRQIGQIDVGAFGVFSTELCISTHFGTVIHLSMFYSIQPLFLQKTKPLYSHPKYLFGIGMWIWEAKN